MSPQLDILVVRLWTLDAGRIRTSLRAAGLTARLTRVDFPAALYAALARRTFSTVLYDPATPSVSLETLNAALREHGATAPVIHLASDDDICNVGHRIAALLLELRN